MCQAGAPRTQSNFQPLQTGSDAGSLSRVNPTLSSGTRGRQSRVNLEEAAALAARCVKQGTGGNGRRWLGLELTPSSRQPCSETGGPTKFTRPGQATGWTPREPGSTFSRAPATNPALRGWGPQHFTHNTVGAECDRSLVLPRHWPELVTPAAV